MGVGYDPLQAPMQESHMDAFGQVRTPARSFSHAVANPIPIGQPRGGRSFFGRLHDPRWPAERVRLQIPPNHQQRTSQAQVGVPEDPNPFMAQDTPDLNLSD